MQQYKDTAEGAAALERAARKHMSEHQGERVIGVREAWSISGDGEKVLRGVIQTPQGRFLGYL